MKTFLSDTNPGIEEKWFEMQRQLSPAERLYKALELTDFVRNFSQRTIQLANPGIDQRTPDLQPGISELLKRSFLECGMTI